MSNGSGVLQAGNITPGHLATWATNSVLQDGGSPIAATKVLGSIRGASFNVTTDQGIIIPQGVLAYVLTAVIVTNASGSLSGAIGGFYTGTSKSGTTIITASQSYATLTSASVLLYATFNDGVANVRFAGVNTIYLSLTDTAVASPVTADCYLIGTDLT